jgi:hypothetical protein
VSVIKALVLVLITIATSALFPYYNTYLNKKQRHVLKKKTYKKYTKEKIKKQSLLTLL